MRSATVAKEAETGKDSAMVHMIDREALTAAGGVKPEAPVPFLRKVADYIGGRRKLFGMTRERTEAERSALARRRMGEVLSPSERKAAGLPVIKTDAELEAASVTIAQVKDLEKSLKKQKQEIAGPIRRALEAVDEAFAPALAECESLLEVIEEPAILYKTERDRKLVEEARRKNELATRAHDREVKKAEGKALPPPPPPAQVSTAAPKTIGGTTFREVWTFEIVDEAKLPRNYLKADEAAIRKAVAAGARGQDIAGVRIFQETTTARASR